MQQGRVRPLMLQWTLCGWGGSPTPPHKPPLQIRQTMGSWYFRGSAILQSLQSFFRSVQENKKRPCVLGMFSSMWSFHVGLQRTSSPARSENGAEQNTWSRLVPEYGNHPLSAAHLNFSLGISLWNSRGVPGERNSPAIASVPEDWHDFAIFMSLCHKGCDFVVAGDSDRDCSADMQNDAFRYENEVVR